MDEPQITHYSLNPHAQEFHPSSHFHSHQHFPQNYPYYPYPHHFRFPGIFSQNALPTPPLLSPQPRAQRVRNTCRRRRRGAGAGGCNYRENRGLSGKNGQGQDGNIRAWGERKKWRREVMPVKPLGVETTVMIRNIPNKYTRGMLMEFLDEFCNEENKKSIKDTEAADHYPSVAYDFLYLPIDFRTEANKGFAFVNFTHPTAVWKLYNVCDNKGWKYCSSSKICQIVCATIQGKNKLKEHFGKSRFLCNKDEYLPVCLSPPRDGSVSPVILTTIAERISPFSHCRSRNSSNSTQVRSAQDS